MKYMFLAFVALGIAFATPANAQFFGWGPYTTGFAGVLGGYYSSAGYGTWGYGPYGPVVVPIQPYYAAPVYAAPVPVYEAPATRIVQRKQIIIKNSPGAQVIEQDIFDW